MGKFYKNHQVWINLLLVPIVAIFLFWLTIKFLDLWTKHGKTAEMPYVVSLDFYKARDILEAQGFEVELDSIYDTQSEHGQVLDQSPKEKEIVKYGRTVYLKINSFYPEMKIVDDKLLHISSIQSKKMLQAMGFKNIVIDTIPGDNDDEVVEIKYNGRKLKNGEKAPVTAEVLLIVTKSDNSTLDSISVDDANAQINYRDSLETLNSIDNEVE